MAKPAKKYSKPSSAAPKAKLATEMASDAAAAKASERTTHVIMAGVICKTETRGFATPDGRPPTELVVDATNGFIPLWAKDVTLRWRFDEQSMAYFQDPDAAKTYIKALFGEAALMWGDAAPVRFSERKDAWDFEISMRPSDECRGGGCVLASAFFPDGGQHNLELYPRLFTQSRQEQVETLIHEIGHIFGLRHFFANITETRWRSEIFGTHEPFSIMNYGDKSKLTPDDLEDLTRLYQMVWSGRLTQINGTPVQMVQPFSATRANAVVLTLAAATEPALALRRPRCSCCGHVQGA